MKTFIYVKDNTNPLIASVNVYQIKRNRPVFLFNIEYKRGLSMGAESEILNELVARKIIPAKLLQLSKNDWRSAGFYCPEVEDNGVVIIQVN